MFCCVSQPFDYNQQTKGDILCHSHYFKFGHMVVYELMKVYSENFMLMETKKVLTCLKYDQRQADIKGEWGWNQLQSLDISTL